MDGKGRNSAKSKRAVKKLVKRRLAARKSRPASFKADAWYETMAQSVSASGRRIGDVTDIASEP